MSKTVEIKVRLYLIALVIIIMTFGAISGFIWVREIKTRGYYFDLKKSNDSEYMNIRRSQNR